MGTSGIKIYALKLKFGGIFAVEFTSKVRKNQNRCLIAILPSLQSA